MGLRFKKILSISILVFFILLSSSYVCNDNMNFGKLKAHAAPKISNSSSVAISLTKVGASVKQYHMSISWDNTDSGHIKISNKSHDQIHTKFNARVKESGEILSKDPVPINNGEEQKFMFEKAENSRYESFVFNLCSQNSDK